MWFAEKTVWPYRFRQGRGALIVSMPHVGTFVPHSVGRELSDCAALRSDTDWHLPKLYDFLADLDATVIAANYSRYVIDVNRPPDGANLYPGRDTPKLCPTDTFSREPLYLKGEPSADEIARRLALIWQPYHARIDREIARVREMHGKAILWDAHSIVSVEPRLFEGRLTDFNLGTADGASCDPVLADRLVSALKQHAGYTSVLNGRFKGGYITRRYGDPAAGVQAIQLEMVMANYMEEKAPFAFREDLAAPVRAILRELLQVAAAHPVPSTGSGDRTLVR
jgi:N-formylglutamate deformylase